MRQATTSGGEVVLRWPLYGPGNSSPAPAEELFARPFATCAEDLDVDFASGLRPAVVTRLLANCLRCAAMEPVPEADLWSWPVSRRMQALLAVAAATSGTGREVAAVCSRAECGQTMEIGLNLEMFRSACADEPFRFSAVPQMDWTVRLPTAADQLQYISEFGGDPLLLARSLFTAGDPARFQAEWLPALESALEERDPLTAIELSAACPYCGEANRVEFDLEGFLLRDLERRQAALFDTVHRLAAVYHWSEDDIVALPRQRRDYYLARIDRETRA
jgi:hypothetical protein